MDKCFCCAAACIGERCTVCSSMECERCGYCSVCCDCFYDLDDDYDDEY